ncbi:RNase H family protein [Glaciibacter sp. 2TAF33]|uniref:RNase H family protein n=1 Tax=Glaciibacter sp. 2TAF33 TaxID=3233015 RepID=UPI003F92DD02
MTIIAAADGSALGNPGPAGWAWYVNDSCWAAGGWPHATNNQGELKAVLELFTATAHLDEDLLVLCDSQYVINSVTKWMPGWKKKGWRKGDGKPVLNLELLKEIDDALVGRRYKFEWVKGHANHPLNEAADARARAAAEAFQRRAPVPSGPGWVRAGDAARAAQAAAKAPAARGAATTPAPAARTPTATVSQPELFMFDDDAPAARDHTVTLTLSDDEHARLLQRARVRGVSVEDLLRALI